MTHPIATLSQIVEAANVAEGRYDPDSCRQVTDVRLVAQMDDAAYYVVLGKTFRRVTSNEWAYAVEVTKDGISCHTENGARNAEAMAFLLADRRRGVAA